MSITVDSTTTLQAEFRPGASRLGVVITHPHPLHGGSMHTPVPTALFDAAAEASLPALRFNFRGVEGSTGTHDKGVGERDDVRASLDALIDRAEVDEVLIAGWSFGADVGLAVDHERLAGWFAVAPPLAVVPIEEMVAPASSKLTTLIVPEHDQFNAPAAAATTTETWTATTVEIASGADHFLAGRMSVVADLFAHFVAALDAR